MNYNILIHNIDFSRFTFKINIVAVIKFICNYIRNKKRKMMCTKWFRNLFAKPLPVSSIMEPTCKRALLFAINDYNGDSNDLNGCINDQKYVTEKLVTMFPGFNIRSFKDAEVTKGRFLSELTGAIKVLRDGDTLIIHYSGHGTQVYDKHGDEVDGYDEAIYLYDGPVVDDDIAAILNTIPKGAKVILFFDSCFSGSITRDFDNIGPKSKFLPYKNLPIRYRLARRLGIKSTSDELNWIVFSGCSENQTSSDAFISGKYRGAFTYYAFSVVKPNMTYNEWKDAIKLPNDIFEQVPTLEGRPDLRNQLIFT